VGPPTRRSRTHRRTRISAIVLTWNRRDDTLACLRSIRDHARVEGLDVELVVVDNGSSDDTPDAVSAAFPDATLVRMPHNTGVPGGRNIGAAHSSGDVLVFVDNDAVVAPGTLTTIDAAFRADAALGLLAARIEKPDTGNLDMACWVYGRDPRQWGDRAFETYSFAGAGFAVRRAAFEATGGFWPVFFFAREEEDLAIRIIDHGFRVVYQPVAVVLHAASPQNRAKRERHLALSLGNSLLVLWRNLPVRLALALSLGKLIVFSLRALQEGYPAAVPQALWVAARKLPSALRSRRCVSAATVATYQRLNPNAHPNPLALRRRLTEVSIETGVRPRTDSWSAVHVGRAEV
jgi:GT2 family glycosyltransferase